jgi:hypothetical protein
LVSPTAQQKKAASAILQQTRALRSGYGWQWDIYANSTRKTRSASRSLPMLLLAAILSVASISQAKPDEWLQEDALQGLVDTSLTEDNLRAFDLGARLMHIPLQAPLALEYVETAGIPEWIADNGDFGPMQLNNRSLSLVNNLMRRLKDMEKMGRVGLHDRALIDGFRFLDVYDYPNGIQFEWVHPGFDTYDRSLNIRVGMALMFSNDVLFREHGVYDLVHNDEFEIVRLLAVAHNVGQDKVEQAVRQAAEVGRVSDWSNFLDSSISRLHADRFSQVFTELNPAQKIGQSLNVRGEHLAWTFCGFCSI